LELVQITQSVLEPTDANQIGRDGNSSPISTQVDFGHAVAMSAEGTRLAVASAPGQPLQEGIAVTTAGWVHLFHYNVTWKYEQTLLAEDSSAPVVVADPDAPSFHPAIDMSEDGERVVFSTPQNSVAVFVRLSKEHGYKFRQLGPSITPSNTTDDGSNLVFGTAVAISATGATVAVLCHYMLEDKAVVRIYQDAETTNFSDKENPVIDKWVFHKEIDLPSSNPHGTLSFEYTGSLLAVGQPAKQVGEGSGGFASAVVSVYTISKADPSDWLLFGDVMLDNQYTPKGSDTPLLLGGVAHLSGDGSTLAVGGKDNVVTVMKWQYASPDQTDVVEWAPVGMGVTPNGAVSGISMYSGFGASVHLNRYGTRLVVGAPGSPELLKQADTLAPDMLPYTYGSIHLYVLDPDKQEWRQVANDCEYPATVSSENQGDNFGIAVSINAVGDRVVVGAPQAGAFGSVTKVKFGPISL
jgi:hypothetical protein